MKSTSALDAYSRQARLQPALLTALPIILTVAVWIPTLSTWATSLMSLAATCGVTAWVVHLTRTRGRVVERQLYDEWGGKPTTMWLRYRDDHLDAHTKARYFSFLQKHIPNWIPPSRSQEQRDPADADTRYDSAVKWLLEHTRDQKKYPLVLKENISYGFRRNLYGLKLLGVSISTFCVAVNALALYRQIGMPNQALRLAGSAALIISVSTLTIWIFLINKHWVRDAADTYARALLACCDARAE